MGNADGFFKQYNCKKIKKEINCRFNEAEKADGVIQFIEIIDSCMDDSSLTSNHPKIETDDKLQRIAPTKSLSLSTPCSH